MRWVHHTGIGLLALVAAATRAAARENDQGCSLWGFRTRPLALTCTIRRVRLQNAVTSPDLRFSRSGPRGPVVLVDHAAEHLAALHPPPERHDDRLVIVGWPLVPAAGSPIAPFELALAAAHDERLRSRLLAYLHLSVSVTQHRGLSHEAELVALVASAPEGPSQKIPG
jgi:hypothetical protein